MSIAILQNYLPHGTLPFLKSWFGHHAVHIKITRERQNKLGDYLKLGNGSHQITINSTLPPALFFFVLTHELAHLLAFERYGWRISPHGAEWKATYRCMLLESIAVYDERIRAAVLEYAKDPKANFMTSPALVRYLDSFSHEQSLIYVEALNEGDHFLYRNKEYRLESRLKKNYLCHELATGRKFTFKPLARVDKI